MARALSPLGSPQLSPNSSPRPSFSSGSRAGRASPRPSFSTFSELEPSEASSSRDVSGPGLLPSHRASSSSSASSSSRSDAGSASGRGRSHLPNLHTNLAHAIGQAVWGPDSPASTESGFDRGSSSRTSPDDDDLEGGADEVFVTPEALSLFGYVRMPGTGLLPWPGPTAETASAVRNLLQECHVKLDCETSDGEANLTMHHLLAIYSLGAPAETLRACYRLRTRDMPSLPKLMERPTDKSWRRWLGSRTHFSSYLAFFTERIASLGAAYAVERYLFGDPTSQMLARACSCHNMLALSTIGLGLEFNLDILVAQGLAHAAVTAPRCAPLFPTSWPPNAGFSRSPLGMQLSSRLSLRGYTPPSFVQSVKRLPRPIPRHPRKGLSAMTVVASMAASNNMPAPDASSPSDRTPLDATVRGCAEALVTWCDEWIIDEDAGWDEIVEKAEELSWLATILFAGTAPQDRPTSLLDPVLAQTLCSIIALPPLLEVLSPGSRVALLRSVFVLLVTSWISRGRPQIQLLSVLSRVSSHPSASQMPSFMPGGMVLGAAQQQRDRKGKGRAVAPNGVLSPPQVASPPKTPVFEEEVILDEEPTTPKASDSKRISGTPPLPRSAAASTSGSSFASSRISSQHASARSSRASSPRRSSTYQAHPSRPRMSSTNSWCSVLASAADHPDPLVSRVVRALAFAGSLYGTTPAGQYRCALPGSESMDGSIFIRAAGLLLDSLGWRREGDEPGQWRPERSSPPTLVVRDPQGVQSPPMSPRMH